ncbi:nuclear transport factor 2 family protein [Jiangella asiatica]|uniref:nuclear transport factor 2 family protein n=1 Tax=Jiangella asiatica TaxID=2530372 RepID=UPI0013A5E71C|nr:nuclear transport factor 2 family protein [Jiangella asiatica]
MDRAQVAEWIEAYERAWRSPGVTALGEIFTDAVSYLQGPYRRPVMGLPAVERMWEAERDGPDEEFELHTEIVAVDDDVAVVRAEVRYGDPLTEEWRDLWIARFGDDGRCRAFEEWPFAPPRDQGTG